MRHATPLLLCTLLGLAATTAAQPPAPEANYPAMMVNAGLWDSPVVANFEVQGVDMSRLPLRKPWHRDDFLPLLRRGSVLVLIYNNPAHMRRLTFEELQQVRLGLAAQEIRALRIADRLMIITAHRVDFIPNDPEEVVSIPATDLTIAALPDLLSSYGEVVIR
jgi:hypothetical protein